MGGSSPPFLRTVCWFQQADSVIDARLIRIQASSENTVTFLGH